MADDAVTSAIDIAEFTNLRQEITARIAVSYTLLTLELAALGGGLSVAGSNVHVLGALAVLAVMLWLFWTNNAAMIRSLGAYIALELAPRLRAESGSPVMGWEAFMNRLFSGGATASRLLFGDESRGRDGSLRWPAGSDWYTTVLLGGSAPLLIAVYIWMNRGGTAGTWILVGLMTALVITLWLYAAISFSRFNRAQKLFSQAILARDEASA